MKNLKIILISDPHTKHAFIDIPSDADMIICSGDFSNQRNPSMNANEVLNFLEWYKSLTHIKYKILVAGNHDTSIEHGLINRSDIHESIIYLEHELCEINLNKGFQHLANSDKQGSTVVPDRIIRIFGSPFTPTFGQGWAFNVPRHKIDSYWQEIPEDIDILVTHGPPLGILDHTECGAPPITLGGNSYGNTSVVSCGDKSLLNHVKRVKPRIHVFGHLHDEDRCLNAGVTQIQGLRTKFINASVVDLDYKICNNGFIIEMDENKNISILN